MTSQENTSGENGVTEEEQLAAGDAEQAQIEAEAAETYKRILEDEPDLIQYIKDEYEKGTPRLRIYTALIEAGHSDERATNALGAVDYGAELEAE